MAEARRWLVSRAARPEARANLYCFPHAGGAAGEYARWSQHLPGLRVSAVQLPGRGHHLDEPAFTSMLSLIEALLDEVTFTDPFALFGHSLGALVAFEVARALRGRGLAQPVRLFVSSCSAPPMPQPRVLLHLFDDPELHVEIERRWGPLPMAVRSDPELLSSALACYRADFALLETYRYAPAEPLDCSIIALVGNRERRGVERMAGWRAHTRGTFDLHQFRGEHFHIRNDCDGVCRLLDRTVTADVTRIEQRMSS